MSQNTNGNSNGTKARRLNLRAVPNQNETGADSSTNAAPGETPIERHGGAREGAGRKPKALKYASELATAEGQIITALPDVIAGLIRAAKGDEKTAPDVAAGKYLIDRVFGRIKEQGAPLAEDVAVPIDPEQWEADRALADRENELMRDLRSGLLQ